MKTHKSKNMISEFFNMDNSHILMILFGSLLAIIGAFMLNAKNSKESKVLLKKVETSIEKSNNAINHITGGDSWCYYDIRLNGIIDETGKLLDKQVLRLILEHDGIYPIPEVHIKFNELIPDKTVENSHHFKVIYDEKISWLGMNGFKLEQVINLKLNDELKVARYQVDFGAPNGAITQEIIFKKDEMNRWHYATKVERIIIIIIDESNPNEHNRRQKQGHPHKLYQFIDKDFPDEALLGWKEFIIEQN